MFSTRTHTNTHMCSRCKACCCDINFVLLSGEMAIQIKELVYVVLWFKMKYISMMCYRMSYCFIHFSCFRRKKKTLSFFIRTFFLFVFRVNSYHVYFLRQFSRKFIDQHSTFRFVTKVALPLKMVIASKTGRPFSHSVIDKQRRLEKECACVCGNMKKASAEER